jgi:membrane-associated phospholipid phosphatase
MPVYTFGMVFLFLPELVFPIRKNMFLPLFGLIAVATFVLPLVFIFLLKRSGIISNIELQERKDRFAPHLVSTSLYAATSYFFYTKLAPVPNAFLILGSMTACMATVTMVNFFWKISAHSSAMGGCTVFAGMVLALYGLDFLWSTLMVVVFLSGLVMASRLYLQMHTLGQVCAGYVIGVAVSWVGLSNISL